MPFRLYDSDNILEMRSSTIVDRKYFRTYSYKMLSLMWVGWGVWTPHSEPESQPLVQLSFDAAARESTCQGRWWGFARGGVSAAGW